MPYSMNRIPKGFRTKSQGCEERATLGKVKRGGLRHGVVGFKLAKPGGRNPFRVDSRTQLRPRVARSSQPWAGGRNPFGIGLSAFLLIFWAISAMAQTPLTSFDAANKLYEQGKYSEAAIPLGLAFQPFYSSSGR